MTKRNRMKAFFKGEPFADGAPAAFFQHFLPDKRNGEMACQEQLRYLRETGMDVLKIMFDNIYPKIEFVDSPEKWTASPRFSQKDPVFFNQLELTKRLVDSAGEDAYVLHTLFSPFVTAGNATTPIMEWDKRVIDHLQKNPKALVDAMIGISEVLVEFAHDLAKAGVDGFYVSVQSWQQSRLPKDMFEEYLKPYDVMFLKALSETGKTVFVHLCGSDIRLESYFDYPGDAFNMAFSKNALTVSQAMENFGRPIMGGLDNHGIIVHGNKEAIQRASLKALEDNPPGMMLGADCTIPSYVPEEHLKWAVETAHTYRPEMKG